MSKELHSSEAAARRVFDAQGLAHYVSPSVRQIVELALAMAFLEGATAALTEKQTLLTSKLPESAVPS